MKKLTREELEEQARQRIRLFSKFIDDTIAKDDKYQKAKNNLDKMEEVYKEALPKAKATINENKFKLPNIKELKRKRINDFCAFKQQDQDYQIKQALKKIKEKEQQERNKQRMIIFLDREVQARLNNNLKYQQAKSEEQKEIATKVVEEVIQETIENKNHNKVKLPDVYALKLAKINNLKQLHKKAKQKSKKIQKTKQQNNNQEQTKIFKINKKLQKDNSNYNCSLQELDQHNNSLRLSK